MPETLTYADYLVRIGLNAENAKIGDLVLTINGRYTPNNAVIFVAQSGRNFIQLFRHYPDLDALNKHFYSDTNTAFKLKPFEALNPTVQKRINASLGR